MERDLLTQAVDLSRDGRAVFLATADRDGQPRISVAENLSPRDGTRIVVRGWYCPEALEDLDSSPRIAIVVWDTASDSGFQILGEVGGIEDLSVLDGYSGDTDDNNVIPQVEMLLVVEAQRVLHFSRAPQCDAPG